MNNIRGRENQDASPSQGVVLIGTRALTDWDTFATSSVLGAMGRSGGIAMDLAERLFIDVAVAGGICLTLAVLMLGG